MPRALALVLAGGRSARFGAGADDMGKAAVLLHGKPLLQWAWQNAVTQCQSAALSVADEAQGEKLCALLGAVPGAAPAKPTWIADAPQWRGMGPLAGIVSTLTHSALEGLDWLLLFPTDTPLLPPHYARSLLQFAEQENLSACYSRYRGRDHYACAIWHRALAPMLRAQLQSGEHSLRAALQNSGAQALDFPATDAQPWFANINTPAELAHWQAHPH